MFTTAYSISDNKYVIENPADNPLMHTTTAPLTKLERKTAAEHPTKLERTKGGAVG